MKRPKQTDNLKIADTALSKLSAKDQAQIAEHVRMLLSEFGIHGMGARTALEILSRVGMAREDQVGLEDMIWMEEEGE